MMRDKHAGIVTVLTAVALLPGMSVSFGNELPDISVSACMTYQGYASVSKYKQTTTSELSVAEARQLRQLLKVALLRASFSSRMATQIFISK
jgi:hypothetical protein